MRNKELKKLANIRLLLLALVVILTIQTAVAGWYCFIKPNSSKNPEGASETTEAPIQTDAPVTPSEGPADPPPPPEDKQDEESSEPASGEEDDSQELNLKPTENTPAGLNGDNKEVTVKHEHTWGKDVVETAPTCTAKGSGKHKCTECPEVEYFTIDALGHDCNVFVSSTPATCTTEGKTEMQCSRCEYIQTTITKPTGHSYDENGVCTICQQAKAAATAAFSSHAPLAHPISERTSSRPVIAFTTSYAVPEASAEAGEAPAPVQPQEEEPGPSKGMLIFFWASLSLLVVCIIAFILVSIEINNLVMQNKAERSFRKWMRKSKQDTLEKTETNPVSADRVQPAPQKDAAAAPAPVPLRSPAPAPRKIPQPAPAVSPYLTVGKAHNIGRRSYQQDSFGHCKVMNDQGLLAVVADGMGGLQGGEKVSQEIVMQCLSSGPRMRPETMSSALSDMVATANTAVNQMLGPDGLYKSGSTLVSVLIKDRQLMWISVGDSRIYLYRGGNITQLSQDHDLLQEWMPDIRSGKLRYEDAVANPDARKLTSFIGMGNLRYIDRSASPLQLQPGDRVLLMSDGVYGTIPDKDMASILARFPDVSQAAAAMEKTIEQVNLSYQDNYTVLIVAI